MSDPLTAELGTVLATLRRQHDILPFLEQMLPSGDVRLAPLPEEMFGLLAASPDFTSIRPGEPVWLSLAAPPDAAAEVVVYRAEANGRHYIVAPDRD